MRKLLLGACLLIAVPASAGTIVGNVNGVLIIKDGESYTVTLTREKRKKGTTKSRRISSHPVQRRQDDFQEKDFFREIVFELENGAGKPVYSRIRGIDIDRVLDKGRYFGAVVSTENVDGESLKRAFKYVVRKGDKYYVVGEWK